MYNCVLTTVRFSLETRCFEAPRRLFAAILSPHHSLDRALRKEIQQAVAKVVSSRPRVDLVPLLDLARSPQIGLFRINPALILLISAASHASHLKLLWYLVSDKALRATRMLAILALRTARYAVHRQLVNCTWKIQQGYDCGSVTMNSLVFQASNKSYIITYETLPSVSELPISHYSTFQYSTIALHAWAPFEA